MSTKKKKFVTPKGVAVYPRLNGPDKKFHDLGVYKADVRIPIEEAKPLLKELGEIYKEHTGSAHPKLAPSKDREAIWYFEQDDDGDFDKDFVILKLRAKNVETKEGDIWDRRPKVFDATGKRIPMVDKRGKPIEGAPKIGGGTVMKVSFEADCYSGKAKGVRLIPLAVQIIDLVEYEEGGSAESYGFGEEEGFSSDMSEEETSDFDTDGDNNDNNDAETESNTEEDFY